MKSSVELKPMKISDIEKLSDKYAENPETFEYAKFYKEEAHRRRVMRSQNKIESYSKSSNHSIGIIKNITVFYFVMMILGIFYKLMVLEGIIDSLPLELFL